MKNIIITFLLLLFTVNVNAALIKQDFLNAGDGLTITDTETGLEWLTPFHTRGHSYGASFIQNLALDHGFRYASLETTRDMINRNFGNPVTWDSASSPHTVTGDTQGFAAAQDFFDVFKITQKQNCHNTQTNFMGGCDYSRGLTSTVGTSWPNTHIQIGMGQYGDIGFQSQGLISDTSSPSGIGSWLIRDTTISIPQRDTPLVLLSDFSSDFPEYWSTRGNGTSEFIDSPVDNDDSKLIQMTIDNPNNSGAVFSSSLIEVPDDPFYIDFDYLFQTDTGRLDLRLNGILLDSIMASDVWDVGQRELLHSSILVDDPELLNGNGYGGLTFFLYPGSPAQAAIGNITMNINTNTFDVPEPSTFAIFTLGMIGLASRRFKKQY
jgi:hypothetical protein